MSTQHPPVLRKPPTAAHSTPLSWQLRGPPPAGAQGQQGPTTPAHTWLLLGRGHHVPGPPHPVHQVALLSGRLVRPLRGASLVWGVCCLVPRLPRDGRTGKASWTDGGRGGRLGLMEDGARSLGRSLEVGLSRPFQTAGMESGQL